MQYLSILSHVALDLELIKEIVEISQSTVSRVLASQEPLFGIAPIALSQDTLLEAAIFKTR